MRVRRYARIYHTMFWVSLESQKRSNDRSWNFISSPNLCIHDTVSCLLQDRWPKLRVSLFVMNGADDVLRFSVRPSIGLSELPSTLES